MKIKLISDIHLDIYKIATGKDFILEDDLSDIDVLVLAGDISEGTKGVHWALDLIKEYKDLQVIYICGNHEYYNNNMNTLPDKVHSLVKDTRVHFLNNSYVILDNVKFIGSTLWSDFKKRSPLVMWDASQRMRDYKYIRYTTQYRKITPEYIYSLHNVSKKYVFEQLNNWEGKSVVVTHHKPYAGSNKELSGAYESDLSHEVLECKNLPKYFLYGHTHTQDDSITDLGDGREVRFVSNPTGYSFEGTCYDKLLVLEV